ncbi:HK97-gp10 family putative phage morphogenesis protein [Rhizobium sp. FY34]|uniref:HK97-gp10 family putative phage morphogenesis protein n=1 Tax=Rhizobium sp. FY34 TaxID=2562309 RepID=UPI0010C065E2|nr:HK97-gp10 family putative phage morphogenesis protein [Rhizobium sp. FY34]
MAPNKGGIRLEGFKELERALMELPKATARNVGKRTLVKAAQPIKNKAQSLAPKDTGELKQRIVVSTKAPANHDPGDIAYSKVMQGGGDQGQAVAAMRAARRASNTLTEVFVGPAHTRNKQAAEKTIVQEFGSKDQPGKPYMRPAWDSEKDTALEIIKTELGNEITKATQRAAKRAAKRVKT